MGTPIIPKNISTGFNFLKARKVFEEDSEKLRHLVGEWEVAKDSYLYNKELFKINAIQDIESERNLAEIEYKELEVKIEPLIESVKKISSVMGLKRERCFEEAKKRIQDKIGDLDYKDRAEEEVNELKMYSFYMGHEYGSEE